MLKLIRRLPGICPAPWPVVPHRARSGQRRFSRWEIVLAETNNRNGKKREGFYTSLTFVEEFRVLMAALYGRVFENKTSRVVGSADDPDLILRCAYYGNTALSPEQIRSAFQRDGDAFVYAALYNENLFTKRDCRAELEECLRGTLRFVYHRRCEQIHQRRPAFDPRPVSETGFAILDDVVDAQAPPDPQALPRLEKRVAELQKETSRLSKLTLWGFAILLGVIVLRRWL
jgi:hypothetical protein